MTWMAVFLVLASACVHAAWNLRGKAHHPSAAFFLGADASVALILLPALYLTFNTLAALPAGFWLWLLISGFFQSAYSTGLAYAYRTGEMTFAYPLIRSLSVTGVVACRLLSGGGPSIGAVAWLGVLLVCSGCALLTVWQWRVSQKGSNASSAVRFACLAAIASAGYTLVDSYLLSYLQAVHELPVPQASAALLLVPLLPLSGVCWLAPYVFFKREERACFVELFKNSKRYVATTGLMIWGSYGLVLVAITHCSDVSYVAVLRQLGLPINHLLGVFALKETNSRFKIASLCAILLGLALVKLG